MNSLCPDFKSDFSILIVKKATKVWRSLNFSDEDISIKTDTLQKELASMNKEEFTFILESCVNKGCPSNGHY